MSSILRKTVFSRVLFALGLLCMVGGVLVLFAAVQGFSRLSVIIPFLFLIAGAILAVCAIKLQKKSIYLFFANLFLLVGFFLFLLALKILPIPFSRAWPLLSIFAGVSMIPAGWRRFSRFHAAWVLPAAAFTGLGCVLLIFSLKLAPWSFKQFMLDWWPIVVVLAGFTLFFVSISHKK
jgi:hypothetical protein